MALIDHEHSGEMDRLDALCKKYPEVEKIRWEIAGKAMAALEAANPLPGAPPSMLKPYQQPQPPGEKDFALLRLALLKAIQADGVAEVAAKKEAKAIADAMQSLLNFTGQGSDKPR